MRSWRHALARFMLAHFGAYPVAFLWAVAAIPLAIHLSIRDVDALHDDVNAIGQLVVRRLAWPAGAAFALLHAIAVPWAFGRDPARAWRAARIGFGAVVGLGVAAGGASWLWLLLR